MSKEKEEVIVIKIIKKKENVFDFSVPLSQFGVKKCFYGRHSSHPHQKKKKKNNKKRREVCCVSSLIFLREMIEQK